MREHRDWKKRNHGPLTPEKLMHILNQIEGGERAKEVYRNLTGEEPPEDKASEVWFMSEGWRSE